MASIERSALMPFSAETMYGIVNDVVAYPDYLPWCGGSKVLLETESLMEASVHMRKGVLNHWFSTRNNLTPNKQIDMQLIEGPFRQLDGCWQFQDLGEDASKIELNLSFEFSNKLTSSVLKPIFSQIANTMVDSFCTRAYEVYGNDPN